MNMVTLKKIRLVVNYILWGIGTASSILVFLIWFGVIPETLNGVNFVINYPAVFGLFAVVIFFLCSLWLGYHIHAWRKPKMIPSSTANTKEMPEFYSSRKELEHAHALEDFLRSAKDEIDLMGFSLWDIVVQNRKTIIDLLKQGKHIRFILLSPTSVDVKRFEDAIVDADIKGQIEKSLEQLRKLKQSLSDLEKGRLDVRTHDLLPFHTIVAVDAKSDSGLLNVEYYIYGTDSQPWISLRISKKNQPQLFEKYWKSFEYVHERSRDIETLDTSNEGETSKEEGKPQSRQAKSAIGELLGELIRYRDLWKNQRKYIAKCKYLPQPDNGKIRSTGDQIRDKLIALEKANIELNGSLEDKLNQTCDGIINFGLEVHEYFPDDKRKFEPGDHLGGFYKERGLVNKGDKILNDVCGLIDTIKEVQKSFV
jgi:hypothetical protein